jgi:hypothetical protein
MARNRRFSGAVLTARDRNEAVTAFCENDRVINKASDEEVAPRLLERIDHLFRKTIRF